MISDSKDRRQAISMVESPLKPIHHSSIFDLSMSNKKQPLSEAMA